MIRTLDLNFSLPSYSKVSLSIEKAVAEIIDP